MLEKKVENLKAQIHNIQYEKDKIELVTRRYFEQTCADFKAEFNLDLIKIQLGNLHPYIKLGSRTEFKETSSSTTTRTLGNDGVYVEMHPNTPPVIRIYIVDNLLTTFRAKLTNATRELKEDSKEEE